MSDCKHENRSEYIKPFGPYVSYCDECEMDFTKESLELIQRAEKAEARVKELEEMLSPFYLHAKALKGNGWFKGSDLMHTVYQQGESRLPWGLFDMLLDEFKEWEQGR